eukprot:2149707-Pleurochrysis_carterae.AAC.3
MTKHTKRVCRAMVIVIIIGAHNDSAAARRAEAPPLTSQAATAPLRGLPCVLAPTPPTQSLTSIRSSRAKVLLHLLS